MIKNINYILKMNSFFMEENFSKLSLNTRSKQNPKGDITV